VGATRTALHRRRSSIADKRIDIGHCPEVLAHAAAMAGAIRTAQGFRLAAHLRTVDPAFAVSRLRD
jgi:hypothetical protein